MFRSASAYLLSIVFCMQTPVETDRSVYDFCQTQDQRAAREEVVCGYDNTKILFSLTNDSLIKQCITPEFKAGAIRCRKPEVFVIEPLSTCKIEYQLPVSVQNSLSLKKKVVLSLYAERMLSVKQNEIEYSKECIAQYESVKPGTEYCATITSD